MAAPALSDCGTGHFSCSLPLRAFSSTSRPCLDSPGPPVAYLVAVYLWVVPFSRCNEILFAFLDDALDRLRGQQPRTPLTPVDRLGLAMRSYLEVAGDFAILYFLLPSQWFSGNLRTIVDAFYFSGATITTVGYGDITPCHELSKLLVLYEVGIGLVLIVVTIGTYLG